MIRARIAVLLTVLALSLADFFHGAFYAINTPIAFCQYA